MAVLFGFEHDQYLYLISSPLPLLPLKLYVYVGDSSGHPICDRCLPQNWYNQSVLFAVTLFGCKIDFAHLRRILYIYIYIHTHTHTYMYIFNIYMHTYICMSIYIMHIYISLSLSLSLYIYIYIVIHRQICFILSELFSVAIHWSWDQNPVDANANLIYIYIYVCVSTY